MKSDLFSKLVPMLKDKKCDLIIEYLEHFNSGEWIYPTAIHRSLKIPIKDIYDILEFCVKEGLVEQYLGIYCPFCQRFTGYNYKTIPDIPEELNCPHCDNLIQNPIKCVTIIYQLPFRQV